MIHVYLFFTLVACSCGYALVRGGAPERVAALTVLAGVGLSVASVPIGYHRFVGVEIDILVLDLTMLIAFQALALTANRFWPMWIAGLQQATVLVHFAKLLAPDIFPLGYAMGLRGWAYMTLVLLAVGTWRHRDRLRLRGADLAWSHRAAPTMRDVS